MHNDSAAQSEPSRGQAESSPTALRWAALRKKVQDRKKLTPNRTVARAIGAGLSLGIFALSVFVMARVLTQLDIAVLRAAVAETSAEQILAASGLTALSYLALTGYDALALRHIRAKAPYRVTAFASFASYAISFTLGFPLVTGGAVRYWIYSRAGLRAGQVVALTLIAGLTFWAGMAFVIGVCLLMKADAVAAIAPLPSSLGRTLGAIILLGIGAYIVWVGLARRRVRISGFRLTLPGVRLSLGQIAMGVIDLCAAAGVLFVLLPQSASIDYFTFTATYVFACILGIVSHAPGGIGVFEATMINFIPGAPTSAIIASLLMFRLFYYLCPFVLALALLGADEALTRWKSLRAAMESRENLVEIDGED